MAVIFVKMAAHHPFAYLVSNPVVLILIGLFAFVSVVVGASEDGRRDLASDIIGPVGGLENSPPPRQQHGMVNVGSALYLFGGEMKNKIRILDACVGAPSYIHVSCLSHECPNDACQKNDVYIYIYTHAHTSICI